MHSLLPGIPGQLTNVLGSLYYFMPEVYLVVLFLLVLVTGLAFGKNAAKHCRIIACMGIGLVMFKDLQQFRFIVTGARFLFSNMLLLHRTTIVFKLITDVLAFILLLYMAWDNRLKIHRKGLSDLYTIVIGSVFGLHLMIMAVNLLAVYVAIELVSIASYILVAYRSENILSTEAGLKYVLFGASASAVMLYGISLIYSYTGTLLLFGGNGVALLTQVNPLSVSFALVLILVGIGFKLSFIPTHFWVPDVYEGAATPVTAYLSTLPKIAAFALLVNFVTPFVFYSSRAVFDFRLVLSAIGIITMIGGNFAAVLQTNVKRLLAYSGIGHTGFALMALVTFTPQGLSALSYYLLVYGLANIAALALANYFENAEGITDVQDYKGLGFKYPLASVCFVIVLISLTGIPVSAGFTSKLFVFSAVYSVYQQNHNVWLMAMLVTGALTTVISLFYYIKVPLNLFIKRAELIVSETKRSVNLVLLPLVIAAMLLLLGIFPGLLLKLM